MRSAGPRALPWPHALHAFGHAAGAPATPRDHAAGWAQQFAARLDAGGWPGPESLGSEEQQQCERLRELLGELSTLGGSGALLDFSAGSGIVARAGGERLL